MTKRTPPDDGKNFPRPNDGHANDTPPAQAQNDAETEHIAAVLIPLDEIGTHPTQKSFTAPAESLPAIAKRLAIAKVHALSVDFTIKRERADVLLSGVLAASLERRCVVSLKPVDEIVDEQFQLRLKPAANNPAGDPADGPMEDWETASTTVPAPLSDADLEEDVDVLRGDAIDLADLAIQQTALAMATYPRRNDLGETAFVEKPADISPFSVLQDLVDDGSDGDS